MEISNKAFIIGGGASGLGLATARLLVGCGARVVLADRNPEAGKKSEADLGKNALFVATDVTDETSVRAAIDRALERFGAIHGMVNCAGVGPAERVLGREGIHRLQSFEDVVRINLIGTFNMIRLCAEKIQHNDPGEGGERGVLINTASVAAYEGQIGQAAYAASKGGIVSMTLPIARELSRFGIRVMTIAPGIFETPMLQNLTDEIRASLGEQVPFPPRLGRPDEFAALVRHILENQMLNGEVIRLDGAIRLAPR